MKRKRWFVLLAPAFLAACDQGPDRTIEQIATALQSNDKVAFEEQFDLARVAAAFDTDEKTIRAEMLDRLFATTDQFKGDDGKPISRLRHLLADGGELDGVEYRGVAEPRVNESNATVGLSLYFPDLDSTFVHDLELEKRDGRWKVVGIQDPDVTWSEVEGARSAKLEAANEVIRARMAEHVALGEVEREIRRERRGFVILPVFYVKIPITNRGQQAVNELKFTADFGEKRYGRTTVPEEQILFEVREPLAPGETRVLEKRVELDWGNRDAFKRGKTSLHVHRLVVRAGAATETIQTYSSFADLFGSGGTATEAP
jgi:hypothetical protein